MHPNAIDNIRQLDEKDRYGYLIRHIAERGELYLVANEDEDWSYLMDEYDESYLPVWADEFFAQEFAAEYGLSVFAYTLKDFLLEGIPFLLDENIGIAAFPLISGTGKYAVTDASTFAANLNYQLDQDFGEALDLPYLA